MSLLPRSNPNELSASKADILVIVALHEEFEYVISALDVTAEAVEKVFSSD